MEETDEGQQNGRPQLKTKQSHCAALSLVVNITHFGFLLRQETPTSPAPAAHDAHVIVAPACLDRKAHPGDFLDP